MFQLRAPDDLTFYVPYSQGVKVYDVRKGDSFPTRLVVKGRWDITYNPTTGKPVMIIRDGQPLDKSEYENKDFLARSYNEIQQSPHVPDFAMDYINKQALGFDESDVEFLELEGEEDWEGEDR